jgi:hypothetical protein
MHPYPLCRVPLPSPRPYTFGTNSWYQESRRWDQTKDSNPTRDRN